MGIVILEDSHMEGDETFEVIMEGIGALTSVTILDDDGMCIQLHNVEQCIIVI